MLIPIIGIFAMGMDDYVAEPVAVNASQTLNNQVLKYQFNNIKMEKDQGIEIIFETKVDTSGINIPKR